MCGVWLIIAEVINELGAKCVWLLLKVIHLDGQFRRQFSTVFDVVLQTPSAGITAIAL